MFRPFRLVALIGALVLALAGLTAAVGAPPADAPASSQQIGR